MADRWLLEDVHRLDQAMIPSLLVLPILLVGLTVGFYLGLVAEGHWKRKPRQWYVVWPSAADRTVLIKAGPYPRRSLARMVVRSRKRAGFVRVGKIVRGDPNG